MRVLVASAGFKEGVGPHEACELIARGIRGLGHPEIEVDCFPLADGGTGLSELLVQSFGGRRETCRVRGPLPDQTVDAAYAVLRDGTCVMDSSAAAGLALVPTTERKPLITSTVGVGDLVLHALEQGCRRFVIGTGDTATNDCGMGFADALGVRFLDEFRDPIPPVGQHLAGVREIDVAGLEGRLQEATFQVACNPNSVLCGKSGTARVYGPQKGAGPAEVIALDAGTECFAGLLERHVGRELRYAPGAGGGGGLAGMIHALFGGRLRFSFDVVREYVGLDAALEAADLVITGEGFLDARTLAGKLPGNIALYAKRFGKPVAAVVGGIDDGLRLLYLNGFDAIEVATPRPCDVHVAIGHADQWLPEAAARLVRKLRLGELIAQ